MGHKEEVFGLRIIENDPGLAWKNGAVPLLWRVIDGSRADVHATGCGLSSEPVDKSVNNMVKAHRNPASHGRELHHAEKNSIVVGDETIQPVVGPLVRPVWPLSSADFWTESACTGARWQRFPACPLLATRV